MANTLHIIGDIHFGGNPVARTDKVAADIAKVGAPVAHIFAGDLTQNGVAAEDASALAWMGGLPSPYKLCIGNHDIFDRVRTGAQASAALGMPAQNFSYDPGGACPRVIVVNPDELATGDNGKITLTANTLTWLDAELAAATKDCMIVSHCPLKGTVVGGTTLYYDSSSEVNFWTDPDADIRTILNNRSRAKLWVAGHSHSPREQPGFLKTESVGSRSILSINASSPWYTGRVIVATAPICSLYFTFAPGKVDVRVRDHGAGVWVAVNGSRVTTLTVPA